MKRNATKIYSVTLFIIWLRYVICCATVLIFLLRLRWLLFIFVTDSMNQVWMDGLLVVE
jgi:hypothetical protein